MRQDSDSNPISNTTNTNQSVSVRRERIDKNRAIRKDKIKNKKQNEEQSSICLSKEQRANLQKVRNREAAQRSREMHKEYVRTLEEENQQLKNKLKRQYCKRCQRELSTDEENQTYLKIEGEQSYVDIQKDNFNEPRIQSIMDFQKVDDQYSPFIRIGNNTHNDNSFGMFLLIATLCLGVFMVTDGMIFGSVQPIITNKRDLMSINDEVKTIQNQLQISSKNNQQMFQSMESITSPTTLKRYTNDGQCLKSLINSSLNSHKNPSVSTHLRGIHDIHSQSNILFCQMPKVYRPEPSGQNIFSRLIDIIVRGSQIMEIVSNSPNIELSNIIQFDGFYRINAEVKSIVEIKDHHCLL